MTRCEQVEGRHAVLELLKPSPPIQKIFVADAQNTKDA